MTPLWLQLRPLNRYIMLVTRTMTGCTTEGDIRLLRSRMINGLSANVLRTAHHFLTILGDRRQSENKGFRLDWHLQLPPPLRLAHVRALDS